MQTPSLLLQNREHFHGKKAVVRKLPATIYFHDWASRVEKVRGGDKISQSLCPPSFIFSSSSFPLRILLYIHMPHPRLGEEEPLTQDFILEGLMCRKPVQAPAKQYSTFLSWVGQYRRDGYYITAWE